MASSLSAYDGDSGDGDGEETVDSLLDMLIGLAVLHTLSPSSDSQLNIDKGEGHDELEDEELEEEEAKTTTPPVLLLLDNDDLNISISREEFRRI